jgi:hypothetical protein
MTDSDKDLIKRLRKADEYEPLGHDGWEAADRIEALTKERDTAREYAGEVRIREKVADDARIEAEAKLTKAVEALRFYAPTKRHLTERWFIQNFGGHDDGELAAATLAELEGKE